MGTTASASYLLDANIDASLEAYNETVSSIANDTSVDIYNIQELEVNNIGVSFKGCNFKIDQFMNIETQVTVEYQNKIGAETDWTAAMTKVAEDMMTQLGEAVAGSLDGYKDIPPLEVPDLLFGGEVSQNITQKISTNMNAFMSQNITDSIGNALKIKGTNQQKLVWNNIGVVCVGSTMQVTQQMNSTMIVEAAMLSTMGNTQDELYNNLDPASGEAQLKDAIQDIQNNAISYNKAIDMVMLSLVGVFLLGGVGMSVYFLLTDKKKTTQVYTKIPYSSSARRVAFQLMGFSEDDYDDEEEEYIQKESSISKRALISIGISMMLSLIAIAAVCITVTLIKNNLPWYKQANGIFGKNTNDDGKIPFLNSDGEPNSEALEGSNTLNGTN